MVEIITRVGRGISTTFEGESLNRFYAIIDSSKKEGHKEVVHLYTGIVVSVGDLSREDIMKWWDSLSDDKKNMMSVKKAVDLQRVTRFFKGIREIWK